MRIINQHLPATGQLSADIKATIENHAMSFDVLVFPAENTQLEPISEGVMQDVVGTLEQDTRTQAFGEVFSSAALEPLNEISHYNMTADGVDYGLQQEQGVFKLLIAKGPVPERSVVAFVVDTDQGLVLRVMYVLSAESVGRKATAGIIYNLIPYLGGLHLLDVKQGDSLDDLRLIEEIGRLLDGVPEPDSSSYLP